MKGTGDCTQGDIGMTAEELDQRLEEMYGGEESEGEVTEGRNAIRNTRFTFIVLQRKLLEVGAHEINLGIHWVFKNLDLQRGLHTEEDSRHESVAFGLEFVMK